MLMFLRSARPAVPPVASPPPPLLRIEEIIEQLREIPDFLQVGGAWELDRLRANSTASNALPGAFVLPPQEQTVADYDFLYVSEETTVRVVVAIAVRDYAIQPGQQSAATKLAQLAHAVRDKLVGFNPTGMDFSLRHVALKPVTDGTPEVLISTTIFETKYSLERALPRPN